TIRRCRATPPSPCKTVASASMRWPSTSKCGWTSPRSGRGKPRSGTDSSLLPIPYNTSGRSIVILAEESAGMSASVPVSLLPVSLSQEGTERLVVQWNDGHRSTYTWKHLRDHCPCAGCRGEFGQPPAPFRILTPGELKPRPPLAPVALTPVGRYAYKIT